MENCCFQAEFSKYFQVYSPLLLSVFVKSLTAKMIPPSVISLLPKKDTDPLECPVSLLNTDVKILAKVLARHLETLAPEMILSTYLSLSN